MKQSPALPLYEEIARDLIGAIEAGTHPVGSLLPAELDLAQRYKVSRQTVRMAMQRLTEIGAVTRRAGSGTRVEPRGTTLGGFQWSLGTLGDLTQLAAATRRDIMSIVPVVMDRGMAREFGAAPGSRWMRLSYLRRPVAGDLRPIGWVDVYLDGKYADVFEGLAENPGLVSEAVERRYGVIVSEVRQEISASALDPAQAKALDAAAGSAALRVLRRYYDQRAGLFEITVSVHPEGRYSVSSVLKRVG